MGAEKRWIFTLFSVALLSLLFLLLYNFSIYSFPRPLPSIVHLGENYPPLFAYYISGEQDDKNRMLRLLLAIYHPRNKYLLHLGAEASEDDRIALIAAINAVPAIRYFGNVDVIGKPSRLNYMGSSHIAATLRAAAILLRMDRNWDWFIELSASDYPLLTQDGTVRFFSSSLHLLISSLEPSDLAHAFSSIDRSLNFLDHSSDLGWKDSIRFQPIVVDPAIYLARRSQIFHATEKRPSPESFKVFTGSPWVTLSRSFTEFCVLGWDNLPRTLLMYFTNIVLAEESYFHSVICNSEGFKNTTVNSDLRFMVWDNPPKMAPHFLNVSDYDSMVRSGALFARQFEKDDPVLDMIDDRILKRGRGSVVPGAWCTERRGFFRDPCTKWGNVDVLKPGRQSKVIEERLRGVLNGFESCKSDAVGD